MIRGPGISAKSFFFFAAIKNRLAPKKADMNPKNDASEDVVLLGILGVQLLGNSGVKLRFLNHEEKYNKECIQAVSMIWLFVAQTTVDLESTRWVFATAGAFEQFTGRISYVIYIFQLGLQLAFHDFGMLGKIIVHAGVDPSFQYLYNRSLYLWRGKMRYSDMY